MSTTTVETKPQVAEERPDCYLIVDQTGQIVANRLIKAEYEKYETWSCQYSAPEIRLRRLYPTVGEPINLLVESRSNQSIKEKVSNHMAKLDFCAKHEAGHATVGYALRLARAHAMSLRPYPYLTGNLTAQIRRRKAVDISFSRGVTAIDVPPFFDADIPLRLSWACYALGGLVACGGDETGAEDDLQKYQSRTLGLARAENGKAPHLRHKLQGLAQEILTDGAIMPRRQRLADELRKYQFLSQEEVEAILDPPSLPDYSHKIVEITKELNLMAPIRSGYL